MGVLHLFFVILYYKVSCALVNTQSNKSLYWHTKFTQIFVAIFGPILRWNFLVRCSTKVTSTISKAWCSERHFKTSWKSGQRTFITTLRASTGMSKPSIITHHCRVDKKSTPDVKPAIFSSRMRSTLCTLRQPLGFLGPIEKVGFGLNLAGSIHVSSVDELTSLRKSKQQNEYAEYLKNQVSQCASAFMLWA